jgi:hypothetical protein
MYQHYSVSILSSPLIAECHSQHTGTLIHYKAHYQYHWHMYLTDQTYDLLYYHYYTTIMQHLKHTDLLHAGDAGVAMQAADSEGSEHDAAAVHEDDMFFEDDDSGSDSDEHDGSAAGDYYHDDDMYDSSDSETASLVAAIAAAAAAGDVAPPQLAASTAAVAASTAAAASAAGDAEQQQLRRSANGRSLRIQTNGNGTSPPQLPRAPEAPKVLSCSY